MIRPVLKILFPIILTLLITISCIKPVSANMAAPPKPSAGNIAGNSPLSNISVLEEELFINLSDVAGGGLAEVTANYKIECGTDINSLELIFVANNLNEKNYLVKLDGNTVNGKISELENIPASWSAPDKIPWKNKKIRYEFTQEGLISFHIESLSRGKHDLEVNYKAVAPESFEGDLSIIRTFVYILKPSEEWKIFKNFHLNIQIPDNWEVTSNLSLKRDSSHSLSGNWTELPAEYLSVAINKPTLKVKVFSALFYIAAWLLFIITAFWWIRKVIKYRIQKQKWVLIQFINSVFVSFLGAVFFFVIFYSEKEFKNYLLDYQMSPVITHGIHYYIIFFPFLWIILGIITIISDYKLTKIVKTKGEKENENYCV